MNRLSLRVIFVSMCCAGLFIQHVAAAPAGLCTYHCFCKARCGSGEVGTSINDAIIDWGAIKTYTDDCLHKDNKTSDCNVACSNVVLPDSRWNNASFLCSKCPSGKITAYASVATKDYKTVQTHIIVNTPAVTATTCTCPSGWMANTTNQLGGVTIDGKCKRDWCASSTGVPGPANGTPIGSWGFTWGNGVAVWGSPSNGGAANCVTTTTTPAVCKIVN